MCSDLHLSERTVVFTTAMMLALGNGTLNRTICVAMTIHDFSSFVLLHQVDKTGCLIETFVPSERLAVLSSRNKSISSEILPCRLKKSFGSFIGFQYDVLSIVCSSNGVIRGKN